MHIFYHTRQVDASHEVLNVDNLWITFMIVGFGCGVDYHAAYQKAPAGIQRFR
jgi:hypothetical protein